jgi:hypothetical protein
MTKLCPPEPKSPLLLYLSASNSVVSGVLVQEKEEEGKIKQIPVYLLTVKFRQPSHEFTFSVGMSFIPYPLVLTPLV